MRHSRVNVMTYQQRYQKGDNTLHLLHLANPCLLTLHAVFQPTPLLEKWNLFVPLQKMVSCCGCCKTALFWTALCVACTWMIAVILPTKMRKLCWRLCGVSNSWMTFSFYFIFIWTFFLVNFIESNFVVLNVWLCFENAWNLCSWYKSKDLITDFFTISLSEPEPAKQRVVPPARQPDPVSALPPPAPKAAAAPVARDGVAAEDFLPVNCMQSLSIRLSWLTKLHSWFFISRINSIKWHVKLLDWKNSLLYFTVFPVISSRTDAAIASQFTLSTQFSVTFYFDRQATLLPSVQTWNFTCPKWMQEEWMESLFSLTCATFLLVNIRSNFLMYSCQNV